MSRRRPICLGVLAMCVWIAARTSDGTAGGAGPLHVSRLNPRYFADASGRPVFLTGSHTWTNLKDRGGTDPPPAFDWPGYLDFLTAHHHSFIRLWTWDLFRQVDRKGQTMFTSPFPWPRTGPGLALDGKPKFDLSRFDESYFDRLRQRVQDAGRRNIYVSIMLFEGWGTLYLDTAWAGHPFNSANNSNGIDGDPAHTGKGLAAYTLEAPAVTRAQEAYVRKVVDSVNDLDNVLYEICNESHTGSTQWQYHMIRFIKDYEAGKAKQHPVGMTGHDGGPTNPELFASPADWISPGCYPEQEGQDYRDNPPLAEGRKVIISDTDHLWGIGGSPDWVWKSVCRGMNPIFMDPYLRNATGPEPTPDPQWDSVRESMGAARRLLEKMDLTRARPSLALASSGYCLAVPGKEYLIFLPGGGAVTVDLSGAAGEMAVEWFDPSHLTRQQSAPVTGAGKVALHAPFPGAAVLYLSSPGH